MDINGKPDPKQIKLATFKEMVSTLMYLERGKRQVNIAQMTEVVKWIIWLLVHHPFRMMALVVRSRKKADEAEQALARRELRWKALRENEGDKLPAKEDQPDKPEKPSRK
jgi:hypothetical protein